MDPSVVRLISEALRSRLMAEADRLLVERGPFPAIDIFRDLSIPRETPELIYDGVDGVGIFIQSVDVGSDCTLRLNRLDGPSYNPNREGIYIGEPIRRLYLTNPAGSGTMHIRIHTNPTALMTVSPELFIYDFFYRDTSGVRKNLALEATLQNVLSEVQIISSSVKNRASGYSKQYLVTTSVTTGDDQAVPDGFKVVVFADSDNTAEVAFTLDGITTPVVGTHASLKKGQGIEVALTNVNKLKFVAAAGTQKINVCVEV